MTTNSAPFVRPLSLGELLDQAIRLYRSKFLTLVGVIAIPYLPLVLLQGLSSYLMLSSVSDFTSSANPFESYGYWGGLAGTYLTLFLQFFLVNGIGAAALTRVAADAYTQRPTGIVEAYRSVGANFGRVVGAMFALAAAFLAVFIWVMVPCVGWVTGVGVIFFVSIIVVPLTIPVVMLERQGGFGAIRRAWDLGRSRFWWMLGFAFVLSLLGQLLVTIPVMLINYGLGLLFAGQFDFEQTAILSSLLSSLTGAASGLLYVPLSLTAMVVAYFDLRVRSEGLDLALQAASQTDPEANIATLAETTPSAPQGNFATGTDVLNFFLLSLIFGLLYALLFGAVFLFLFGMGATMGL